MKDITNNIIEKASDLFMQYGIQTVSMDDIASNCGISKKKLYEKFQSKEILVETIIQKLILKTCKFIRLCTAISPNAIIEVKNFSEYIQETLQILRPKFIRDLKRYYQPAYYQLTQLKDNSLIPYIESCLNRGITEDIFRPAIIKRNAGWFYCWQIQNLLETETYYTDQNIIIVNINDLFLHGILNSKGRKLLSIKN